MADQIIITDDEPQAKPQKPEVVVVAPQTPAKTEKKVVTEKVTVSETKDQ